MIKQTLEEYAYLEKAPLDYDSPVTLDTTFCDYLDIWLAGRKFEIKNSTFEVYTFRINAIKRYFEPKHYKLVDITPKFWIYILNTACNTEKQTKKQKNWDRYQFVQSGIIGISFIPSLPKRQSMA